MGKRQENSRLREDAILQRSLEVFAQEGFHGADVQVIADLAGVGKGTVYRHFGNKERLFLATARWCVEQVATHIERKLGNPAAFAAFAKKHGVAELLKRTGLICAEFYQGEPRAIEMMIMERAEFRNSIVPTHLLHRAETRGKFDQLIQSAIDSGEFRMTDASQVTDAFADFLFGTIVNSCIGGSASKLHERVGLAMDFFLSGLTTESGGRHSLSQKPDSRKQELMSKPVRRKR